MDSEIQTFKDLDWQQIEDLPTGWNDDDEGLDRPEPPTKEFVKAARIKRFGTCFVFVFPYSKY